MSNVVNIGDIPCIEVPENPHIKTRADLLNSAKNLYNKGCSVNIDKFESFNKSIKSDYEILKNSINKNNILNITNISLVSILNILLIVSILQLK